MGCLKTTYIKKEKADIRIVLALAITILLVMPAVNAVSPEVSTEPPVEVQAESVVAETIEEPIETETVQEVEPVTWRDNPNNCDQSTHYISAEDFSCIKKRTDQGTSQSTPVASVTGNKESWLRASGIPESQWHYVDYIVSRESSWNPRAVNKSSGACGLAQALPCSKLGSNWYDPVHALRWQYQYVTARYGGYAGAYQFWLANHWY